MAAHKSSQEWNDILSAYEVRTVTQNQFCSDYGISLASLYYHRRKRKQRPRSDESELIELQHPVQNSSQILPAPNCHIEYLDPILGQMKISCGANQVGQVVEGLSSTRGYDIA